MYEMNDKVEYLGCSDAQINYRGHDDPRGKLTEGQTYEIHYKRVWNSYTDIYLVGYEKFRFNSVCFRTVK